MPPRSPHQTLEGGFSLASLLCSVAIVATLIALLFPALNKVSSISRSTTCLNNLRQISVASSAYSGDHRGEWPPNGIGVGIYITSLIPYFGDIPSRPSLNFNKSPLICPSAGSTLPDGTYRYRGFYTLSVNVDGVTRSYGLCYAQNAYAANSTAMYSMKRRTEAENPSQTMLYMDFEAHYVAAYGLINKEALAERHGGKVNIAYMDGSIRPIPLAHVPTASNQMPNYFWHGFGKTTP